jgi:hypothetical protein
MGRAMRHIGSFQSQTSLIRNQSRDSIGRGQGSSLQKTNNSITDAKNKSTKSLIFKENTSNVAIR